MANKTVRVCDVFGTHKDVTTVKVTVEIEGQLVPIHQRTFDASLRARRRLCRFVDKGCKPPTAVTETAK